MGRGLALLAVLCMLTVSFFPSVLSGNSGTGRSTLYFFVGRVPAQGQSG
jgi:hypothetical protein